MGGDQDRLGKLHVSSHMPVVIGDWALIVGWDGGHARGALHKGPCCSLGRRHDI